MTGDFDACLFCSKTLEDDERRFANVERLRVTCAVCKVSFELPGVYRSTPSAEAKALGVEPLRSGLSCATPGCRGLVRSAEDVAALGNALSAAIRQHIVRYYESACQCSECHARVPMGASGWGLRCPFYPCRGALRREYSSEALRTQLEYYCHLFDTEAMEEKVANFNRDRAHTGGERRMPKVEGVVPEAHRRAFATLLDLARRFSDASGAQYVSLSRIAGCDLRKRDSQDVAPNIARS
jgi:hypothetical protein